MIRATGLIAALTLISRLLGVVREAVFSYFFSTSEVLSAFRIAFMAPNLARRLFGEGALSAATIPLLTRSLQTDGDAQARRFMGTLLLWLALVTIVAVLLIEGLIAGWRTVSQDPALELAALVMPYMVLICLVAIASGILNVRGHFATPAAVPSILNLAIILGAWLGATRFGLSGMPLMYVVCGSVLVGGLLQLVVTGAALRAVRFFPRFDGGLRDPRMRSVVVLMAPMVLGLSAVQINALVDYLIAYFFIVEDGERVGPAVLGYAQYLYQLPLGVFGIALATAIFPILSDRAARDDHEGLADVLRRGIRLSLFIALPASVGLMFVARPLVATLYQRGEFGAAETERVAGVLFFYSAGITAYFLQHLLARAFYALHDSRTPARIAASIVLLDVAMNMVLVFVMQERGLALSTAVCATIQVIWLACLFSRRLPDLRWSQLRGGITRMLLCTVAMSAVLIAVGALPLSDWFGESAAWRLLIMVTAGIATYGLCAKCLGLEELGVLLRLGRER